MTDTSTSTVLYEEHGPVAVVTLNRPSALNSFDRQMHHDLWAAFDQAEANAKIRAMVLTGAGRGFAPVPICRPLISRRDLTAWLGLILGPSLTRLSTPPHGASNPCACPLWPP
jgi:hypothetical protein